MDINKFLYCKSCSLIFKIDNIFNYENENNNLRCPLCGGISLGDENAFLDEIIGRILNFLETLERLRQKMENTCSQLDKIFAKLLLTRKCGIFISPNLNSSVIEIFAEVDELGVSFTKFINYVTEDLKKRLKDLIDSIRESKKARLNEYLPVNLTSFYSEEISKIDDILRRIEIKIGEMSGEINFLYGLIDLKKELKIKENLMDLIQDGNYMLIISEGYLYEIYILQKRVTKKIELASIQNVEKKRLSKMACLRLIKGKLKLHVKYTDDLRLRILRLAVVEQPKSNIDDLILLKDVAFPNFLNITNALVNLKEELLKYLLKLNKIIRRNELIIKIELTNKYFG